MDVHNRVVDVYSRQDAMYVARGTGCCLLFVDVRGLVDGSVGGVVVCKSVVVLGERFLMAAFIVGVCQRTQVFNAHQKAFYRPPECDGGGSAQSTVPDA